MVVVGVDGEDKSLDAGQMQMWTGRVVRHQATGVEHSDSRNLLRAFTRSEQGQTSAHAIAGDADMWAVDAGQRRQCVEIAMEIGYDDLVGQRPHPGRRDGEERLPVLGTEQVVLGCHLGGRAVAVEQIGHRDDVAPGGDAIGHRTCLRP